MINVFNDSVDRFKWNLNFSGTKCDQIQVKEVFSGTEKSNAPSFCLRVCLVWSSSPARLLRASSCLWTSASWTLASGRVQISSSSCPPSLFVTKLIPRVLSSICRSALSWTSSLRSWWSLRASWRPQVRNLWTFCTQKYSEDSIKPFIPPFCFYSFKKGGTAQTMTE